jgi:hypothetical protein
MKRMTWTLLLLLFGICSFVRAQMGMDLFERPTFTKIFHPMVGQGGEYEMVSKRGQGEKTSKMEMGIVSKDSVDGKDAYWMQMVLQMESGQTMVSKMLMSTGDFQPSRVIMQMPGRPAMEIPANMAGSKRDKVASAAQDWHSVGTESITVPAGTFSCEHWKNDTTGGEVWTSDKVTPFGLVKEAGNDHTMVLLKVLSDYSDRITGPVQKFDPQMMMQQMQRQQPQQ